jgi:hypothetical protein
VCVPGKANQTLRLRIGKANPSVDARRFASARDRLPVDARPLSAWTRTPQLQKAPREITGVLVLSDGKSFAKRPPSRNTRDQRDGNRADDEGQATDNHEDLKTHMPPHRATVPAPRR